MERQDRSGIRCVVLVANVECLYKSPWHQLDLMAQLQQLACPVMRSAGRFHSCKARRPVCRMLKKRGASDWLVHDLARDLVHVMHVENSRCNVDFNWCRIHR
jgi:hypothetical protein